MEGTGAARDWRDHADFYASGPYARYLRGRRVIGRQPVAMFEAVQPDGHYPDPAMPNALLYVARRGAREAMFDWGAGRWRGIWRTGDLTLVPPDAASDVMLSQRHGFIGLCLPVGLFGGKAGCAALGPLHGGPFRDPLILSLCDALWHSGERSGPDNALFADSALQCLADRLRWLAGAARDAEGPGLSRSELSLIDDHIRANLDGRITIPDLAALTGRSASHFSVLFRQATGHSPYRHVQNARLDRAVALIRAGRLSLAQIALDCGFSSQSHMSATFRTMRGTTPGAIAAAEARRG